MPFPIAAILLAAGRSTRFASGAKLLAPFAGKPLVRWAADAARASRARPIIAVTGPQRAEIEAAIGPEEVRFVHNPHYARGVATSLRAGVAALPEHVAGALVCLGDMPRVSAPLLDALIRAFETAPPGTCAVVPTHAGRPGNPALIGRAFFPRVASLTGDEGARRLLRAAGAPVLHLPVEDALTFFDVDTDADIDSPSRCAKVASGKKL